MKKILLLTTALLALIAVKAQNLEFKYQGQVLDDNATVTIAAEEDFFGEMSCETNPSSAPQDGLVLKCPASALGSTITANLQIMSNTLNASSIQWCMGGNCTLVRQTQLTKTFSPGPTVQVLLDATNITKKGSLKAKLTVSSNDNTRTVFIQFVNGDDETGIQLPSSFLDGEKAGASLQKGLDGFIYDLSGRKANPASQKSKVKNLYIVNGKKILK